MKRKRPCRIFSYHCIKKLHSQSRGCSCYNCYAHLITSFRFLHSDWYTAHGFLSHFHIVWQTLGIDAGSLSTSHIFPSPRQVFHPVFELPVPDIFLHTIHSQYNFHPQKACWYVLLSDGKLAVRLPLQQKLVWNVSFAYCSVFH